MQRFFLTFGQSPKAQFLAAVSLFFISNILDAGTL